MSTSYSHALRNPTFINPADGLVMPNDSGWQTRHIAALKVPRDFERSIVEMLEGWARYADEHKRRYESRVSDDHVMGEGWQAVGRAIHTLLDGETGRLDCGTLSSFIYNTLEFEGFNRE
jgi:hypothetical protein